MVDLQARDDMGRTIEQYDYCPQCLARVTPDIDENGAACPIHGTDTIFLARTKKQSGHRVYLNDWEMLAVEAGLRLLKGSGKAQYIGVELLLKKLAKV